MKIICANQEVLDNINPSAFNNAQTFKDLCQDLPLAAEAFPLINFSKTDIENYLLHAQDDSLSGAELHLFMQIADYLGDLVMMHALYPKLNFYLERKIEMQHHYSIINLHLGDNRIVVQDKFDFECINHPKIILTHIIQNFHYIFRESFNTLALESGNGAVLETIGNIMKGFFDKNAQQSNSIIATIINNVNDMNDLTIDAIRLDGKHFNLPVKNKIHGHFFGYSIEVDQTINEFSRYVQQQLIKDPQKTYDMLTRYEFKGAMYGSRFYILVVDGQMDTLALPNIKEINNYNMVMSTMTNLFKSMNQ